MKLFNLILITLMSVGCVDFPVFEGSYGVSKNSKRVEKPNVEDSESWMTQEQAEVFYNCDLKFDNLDLCLDVGYENPSAKNYWYLDFQLWRWNEELQVKEFFSPNQFEVQGSKFGVDVFMPSMGHGSNDCQVVVETVTDSAYFTEGTIFRARKIDFVMGGSWDVRFVFGKSVKEDHNECWYDWPVNEQQDKVSFKVDLGW